MLKVLTGFHMEKVSLKESFKLMITFASKKLVIKTSWVFMYSIRLEFSAAAKQIINCERPKQILRKIAAK